MRDLILIEGAISLTDALDLGRLDRVPGILARDPAALERPFAKELTRDPRPEDWQTPLVRMVERGSADAVRLLLQHGADRAARHPDGRALLQVARDKGLDGITVLLLERGGV
jgi:hypothetical protein